MRRLLVALLPLLAACPAPGPQVIAHRGASWDAPEHSFAAWDLALAEGADWIEQDLQMTRDSVLVVLHDDSLDRTARGPDGSCTGLVRDHAWAELSACEVGSWFNRERPDRARDAYAEERIPTLDAVLTRYAGRARFYIETKSPEAAPGMEDALLSLLRKHGLAGRAGRGRLLVQSFSAASLQRLHRMDPQLHLVQLLDDAIAPDSLEAALASIARYAVGVGPSRRIVSARFVEAAHAAGLVVHPYTVNDPAVMDYLLGLGVDGMFTDRPGMLRERLRR